MQIIELAAAARPVEPLLSFLVLLHEKTFALVLDQFPVGPHRSYCVFEAVGFYLKLEPFISLRVALRVEAALDSTGKDASFFEAESHSFDSAGEVVIEVFFQLVVEEVVDPAISLDVFFSQLVDERPLVGQ